MRRLRGLLAAMGMVLAVSAIAGEEYPPVSVQVTPIRVTDRAWYVQGLQGAASAANEAYAKTDWSRYAMLPAFAEANRVNAYGTYLLMERESLAK